MDDIKHSSAKKGSNEWKLFRWFMSHKTVDSRTSKYPPLEIMDLPKLISTLTQKGYRFGKESKCKTNKDGVTKHYVEYTLMEKVEVDI